MSVAQKLFKKKRINSMKKNNLLEISVSIEGEADDQTMYFFLQYFIFL
jgi:hypothetical protein